MGCCGGFFRWVFFFHFHFSPSSQGQTQQASPRRMPIPAACGGRRGKGARLGTGRGEEGGQGATPLRPGPGPGPGPLLLALGRAAVLRVMGGVGCGQVSPLSRPVASAGAPPGATRARFPAWRAGSRRLRLFLGFVASPQLTPEIGNSRCK